MKKSNLTAAEALKKLMDGNLQFVNQGKNTGNVSKEIRTQTAIEGQNPYAIIVGCSDSRVIPESIFQVGIGELFVIRVAGNVIDRHQLGSIEYAIEHLGCNLVVVLGHEHCGAVAAALSGDVSDTSHIKYIVDEILQAAQSETDENKVCLLNVKHGIDKIKEYLSAQNLLSENNISVVGAYYHLKDGLVEFMYK